MPEMAVQIATLQKEGSAKKAPRFRSGQTVRVYRKIREGNKERVQMFEGLVIEAKNQGSNAASITVRKIIKGIGVEQVVPLYSPLVEKVELVKEAKVRRSRLYFMRNLRGKAARLKERFFTEEELRQHTLTDEEIEEAVQHEAEEKAKEESATETAEAPAEETSSADEATQPETEDKKVS